MALKKVSASAQPARASSRTKLYPHRGCGEADQGPRQGEVRRDDRGRDEPRRRSRVTPTRWSAASCNLPNGSGRTVRVAVFARGAKADEAKAAGADIVGAEDLVEIVNGGKIEFDRCIATPDMMPLVGRLGKVLGPRGLMPNPKVGTVTMDVKSAVEAAKGGAVEFRVEKAGIVHAGIGKASFDEGKLDREHQGFRRCRLQGEAGRRQGHLHPARRGLLHDGPGREGRSVVRSERLISRSNRIRKPGARRRAFSFQCLASIKVAVGA